MSVVETITSVTLPIIATLLLTAVAILVAEREGRKHDRRFWDMMREHLLRARDTLIRLEERGVDMADESLDIFRPQDTDVLDLTSPSWTAKGESST